MTSSHRSTTEINDWAETSRWLGIISLLPYLILGIVIYIGKRIEAHAIQIEFILALFCLVWGILLGSISCITGIVAIQQIKNSQDTENGAPRAFLGVFLGSTAIIVNLLFVFIPFVILMARD